MTRHAIIGRCAALLLTALLTACASDRQVMLQAGSAHKDLKPAVMDDPQLNQYLEALGTRIVAAARELDAQRFGPKSHFKGGDNQWMFTNEKFHLVNSQTLNAFTTGGEHMYIYNELFRQCKSEDELAAVMAHEYAHVYARHVHKGMNRQATVLGATVAAGAAGYAAGGNNRGQTAATAAGATMAAGSFIGMGFTRSDEAQADELGVQFHARAGWDPAKFAGFFRTMIEKGYDTTPELMSDHPSLRNRVKAVDEYARALPPESRSWRRPPVADEQRFAQLQARAQRIGKSMPADDSLAKAQALLNSFSNCILPPAK